MVFPPFNAECTVVRKSVRSPNHVQYGVQFDKISQSVQKAISWWSSFLICKNRKSCVRILFMPSIKLNSLIAGLLLLSACNKQQFVVPEESKSFEQAVTYNNKVDIVLMVDNSSSMDIYQNKLANQVPEMLSALDQVGMDYQIVVVTTDMRSTGNGGKFTSTPRVLTNGSANLAAALTARVKQGTGGSDLERGLLSIKTALSPAYLNSAGRGFLRNDALLAVIVLSNEDDRSDGDLQEYKTFFEQLKPNMKTAFGDTRFLDG